MKYAGILTLVILITFSLHITVLTLSKLPLFDHKIILSYIVNYIMAITIYMVLYKLKERFETQIGFLFMGGSFFKFIIFFILFFPSYTQDGDINTLEFLSFFAPYAVCLIVETVAIANFLKDL